MHKFTEDISHIELPALFTWPFHYEPHPLSRLAAAEVQRYLASKSEWREEIQGGKMFGVLVVRDREGGIGFLAAFSGNLCVITTKPGYASAISVPIDSKGIPEILGSIAGDNNIILVLKENCNKDRLMEELIMLFPSIANI